MEDIYISTHGIQVLLQRLDSSKGYGPDGLTKAFLKLCASTLAQFLKVLVDKSLLDASLPSDWKKAMIVPIHKSGSQSDVSNYRPIFLTSVACKILERLIYTSIVEHMNKYSLFTPQQHGFRRGFSCTTQLTEFTHDIAYALDKRKTNDCIFLDFKDAFDTVPHRLLLEKMTMYGINSQVIAWVTDYLTLRQQTVIVNGASSCASQVTSGVPQGSVLGPLLFLIYVDITEGVESHIRLFADDCVLYREITDSREKAFIQRDLTKISDWCTRWHMHLNLNKTVTPCKVSDIVHN